MIDRNRWPIQKGDKVRYEARGRFRQGKVIATFMEGAMVQDDETTFWNLLPGDAMVVVRSLHAD